MIATPLPAEPEYMSGSAITFLADEPPTPAKLIPDVVQLYPARLFIYEVRLWRGGSVHLPNERALQNLYSLISKISAEDTFQQT
jgi:hypothetical protein